MIEMYWKYFCCNSSIRIAFKCHHSRISLCISQTGTTQTAGAWNKGGNFIGQLCISVVPHYIQHSKLRLFANDRIIYREIKSIHDAELLQSDWEAAGRWEQDWLMHFHPDKCNILNVTKRKSPVQFCYKLNYIIIS